jgi:hypothetical protein
MACMVSSDKVNVRTTNQANSIVFTVCLDHYLQLPSYQH